MRVVDVNRVIDDLQQLLRRLLGPSIEIELALDLAVQHALTDEQQLEQVLINLAVNARDAMPDGGRLTIATEDAGDAVLLRVADTGIGMDDATRQRIFEPFFTTKDAGEGTGLGLSTVYGIVSQSGGEIQVDTAPGAGAAFTVTLPAAAGVEDDAELMRAPASGGPTGRVLLVDDEAGVRKVAGRALARAGHELVVAGSGQEALDVLDGGQPIDLLITDLAMPGMNGIELAQRGSISRGTPTRCWRPSARGTRPSTSSRSPSRPRPSRHGSRACSVIGEPMVPRRCLKAKTYFGESWTSPSATKTEPGVRALRRGSVGGTASTLARVLAA